MNLHAQGQVRGLRTLLYLAKLDPQVFCGMIEEDMWEIIIAAMPESKDMYILPYKLLCSKYR